MISCNRVNLISLFFRTYSIEQLPRHLARDKTMASHVGVFEQAIAGAPIVPGAATSEAMPGASKKTREKTSRRSHKAAIPFIRGPIPLNWITKASALSRSASRLSIALWYRLGLTGQHVDLTSPNEKPLVVRIDRQLRENCSLERWHVSEGVRDLTTAGLIRPVKAGRGRCPEVQVLAYGQAERGL